VEATLEQPRLDPVARALPLVEVDAIAGLDVDPIAHLRLTDAAAHLDADRADDLAGRARAARPRLAAAEGQVVADLVRPVVVVQLHDAQLEVAQGLPAHDPGHVAALAQALADDHLQIGKHALGERQALRR